MRSSEFIVESLGLNYPVAFGPAHTENRQRTIALTNEEDASSDVSERVIDFYINNVNKFSKNPVENFDDKAAQLINKAPSQIKDKVSKILEKAKTNPFVQGGVITTIGALLTGGLLTTAQTMNLSPQQTNLLLQAVLNTVIPTVVSRVNGKNWKDTIKYTLASAGIGTGIATIVEKDNE